MSYAFVCEAQRFKYSTRYALLLEADILRGKQNLRDLKALLVQRYVLRVDTYVHKGVLSSILSAA